MRHGMAGIGAFWCIVEMLYEEDGILPIEYDRIAFELRTDNDLIKSVIQDFELFIIEDDHFYSESVNDRIKIRTDKSDQARENVQKRWNKYKRNTDVKQTKDVGNTNKVKKSKEKDIKEKNILYQSAIDFYFQWHKELFGFVPKIDGTQGKALKAILAYIKTIYKNENLPADDKNILNGFSAILNNWNKLDKFYYNRTKLSEINSNIQNIIKILKNGRNAKIGVTNDDLDAIANGITINKD